MPNTPLAVPQISHMHHRLIRAILWVPLSAVARIEVPEPSGKRMLAAKRARMPISPPANVTLLPLASAPGLSALGSECVLPYLDPEQLYADDVRLTVRPSRTRHRE